MFVVGLDSKAVPLTQSSATNLVSLCRRHHRAVHEQGWSIRIVDGTAVVEAPP